MGNQLGTSDWSRYPRLSRWGPRHCARVVFWQLCHQRNKFHRTMLGHVQTWFNPHDVNVNPTTVSALSHGGKQVCAIETPGSTPKCWGQNTDGEHRQQHNNQKHIDGHALTCVIMLTTPCNAGLRRIFPVHPQTPHVPWVGYRGRHRRQFCVRNPFVGQHSVVLGTVNQDPSSLPAAGCGSSSHDCHTGCQNYVCVVGVSDSGVLLIREYVAILAG